MRKIKVYLLMMVFLSILTQGCGTEGKVPNPNKASLEIAEQETKALNVDIYFDGTPSMIGYVKTGANTSYGQVVPLLEQATTRSWPNGQVSFYKFGNEITKLDGREFLKASTTSFYEYNEYFKNTCIDKVIDNAMLKNLTVIVTDLFENESDTNLLNKKLKDKYLASNMSIGVLGIKSQFEGVVYDIGIDKSNIQYSSGTDVGRFRPFYVLVLGKPMDVIKYVENLKKSGLSKIPEANFSLNTSNIVSPLSNLNDSVLVTKEKLAVVNNLVEKDGTNNIKQFRVKKKEDEAWFTAKLKYTQLPYIRKFDTKQIETQLVAKVFDNDKLQGVTNLSNAVKISNIKVKDTELQFDVKLSVKDLPLNKICYFEFSLLPKSEAFEEPQWISSWNMNPSKMKEWIEKPEAFDGGTTINLERFINGLWESNIEINKPRIANCYFYIVKE